MPLHCLFLQARLRVRERLSAFAHRPRRLSRVHARLAKSLGITPG
jgi:hypothetical protein